MRPSGWDKRLRAFIEAAERKPFLWGEHDCALFAIAAHEVVTGRAVVREHHWSNAREAARLLRDLPLRDFGDRWFGPSVDGWNTARRGDIVLIGSDRAFMGQPALAVCVGPTVACPGGTGLQFEALRHSFCTWRID